MISQYVGVAPPGGNAWGMPSIRSINTMRLPCPLRFPVSRGAGFVGGIFFCGMEAKAETLHLWSASYWSKSLIFYVCSIWILANHEQINYESPNIEWHLLHIRVDSSTYHNLIFLHSGSWQVERWQADEDVVFWAMEATIAFLKMIPQMIAGSWDWELDQIFIRSQEGWRLLNQPNICQQFVDRNTAMCSLFFAQTLKENFMPQLLMMSPQMMPNFIW